MKHILIFLTLIPLISSVADAAQHFKTASAIPMPELVQELQKVYDQQIKGKEVISISVEGHTDQRASIAYNQKLSEARAKSAVDLLVKFGADKSKITSVGKGELELLTNGTSDEEYARNRRVVVIVKSKTGTTTAVISEAKKCEEKIVEKVVERTKIKHHIVSVFFHQGVVSNETRSYSSGSKVIGEAAIEENYIPAAAYQYQFNNGIVPMIGIDIKRNPKLNLGVGYEF